MGGAQRISHSYIAYLSFVVPHPNKVRIANSNGLLGAWSLE